MNHFSPKSQSCHVVGYDVNKNKPIARIDKFRKNMINNCLYKSDNTAFNKFFGFNQYGFCVDKVNKKSKVMMAFNNQHR